MKEQEKNSEGPFGNLFFSIPRTKQQYARYIHNNDFFER